MLFTTLLFSFLLALTGSSSVRTVNKIRATAKQGSPVEGRDDAWRTPNPCPDRATAVNDPLQEEQPRQAGIKFYLERKDFGTDDLNILNVFDRILGLNLSRMIGLHEVTVEPNNQTVQELEAALNDAWMSSLEAAMDHKWKVYFAPPERTMNRSNYNDNPLSIRIVSLSDSGQLLTSNGSAITRIIYTVILSNTSSLSTSRYLTVHQLQRISSPTKEVFTERLAARGLAVYTGELFPSQSVIIKTRPGDLDSSGIKRQIVADYERNSPDRSCINSDDLEIRFANVSHATATPEARFKPLYSVNCLVFGKNQTIQWQSHPEKRRTLYERVIYDDSEWQDSHSIQRPLNPAFSFRMHSAAPVNLQLLPELESAMTRFFQNKLGYRGGRSVKVFIWKPDVDHASTVNFFIGLTERKKYLHLDSRLFYAETIYRYLENSTMDSYDSTDRISVRLNRKPQIVNGTDSQLTQFLQECNNGQLSTEAQSEGNCRFTLQFMTKEPKSQLPSTERILYHVRSALSEANMLTVNSAYFNITFVNQKVLFRTLKGQMVFGLDFSFSYHQLTSGKFWNVWRLPLNLINTKIETDQSTKSFLALHQSFSFRLYTSVPISIQYAQRFADYLKDKARVYDLGSLVPFNPDINGTGAFDFFAIRKEGTYGEKLIRPESSGGRQIYESLTQGQRFNFLDASDQRTSVRSSRYSSSRSTRGILLARQPFNNTVPAQEKEPNSTVASCVGPSSDNFAPCLLPSTFTLLVQEMRDTEHTQYGNNDRAIGAEDFLLAVGNAFAEANPAIIENVELNVTLTDSNEDFRTIEGDWVTKMEFTLTYPEMESGKYSKLWKYPKDEVLKRHLAKTSANLVALPFY